MFLRHTFDMTHLEVIIWGNLSNQNCGRFLTPGKGCNGFEGDCTLANQYDSRELHLILTYQGFVGQCNNFPFMKLFFLRNGFYECETLDSP